MLTSSDLSVRVDNLGPFARGSNQLMYPFQASTGLVYLGTYGPRPAKFYEIDPESGGRSYVGRVYVSARSARDQATMFLWVDLAPGQRVSAVCEVQARTDGWQPLVVTFTAPPEAKQATVFLGMHDFAQGDTVLFDDALLAPLP